MNRTDLEVKIESLKKMILDSQQSTSNHTGQLVEMEKKLEDLGKPKASSEFLDKINETITEAVENLELDDSITCDFELSYDNRIEVSNVCFENTREIADKIYCAVELLFAEIIEKEDK